ncbi:zinc-binding dehydrogenase [Candidatus Woesearchaeota archaeon]|nr:zinc-binding dehydrogenase [Candidatus Woesearchaeota archaeon]
MKVGMYYNNKDVRVEEMPIPKINSKELLVKVIASGICGSDVMEWYRIKKAPLVLGHEISGEVVKAGKHVQEYKKGDRVFVSHHVPCNTCKYCLDDKHTACHTLHTTNYYPGGFAQFLRVPQINVDRGVYKLPESMSFDEGTFIEPLACVYRGQRKMGLKQGESVLVLGSGISGLLHINLAKASGAGRIVATDISQYRLEKALQFGADQAINSKDYKVEKFDKIILCTGAKPAIEQALQSVDKGGAIEFFAPANQDVQVTIPVNDFWRNEVKVMTSYGAGPKDLQTAIDLIVNKRVNVNDMITHKLKLEEIAAGFKLVAEAKESVKVIIHPNE